MPKSNPSLAEYTVDDLVREVCSRCAIAVVVAVVPETAKHYEVRSYHSGNPYSRIRLLEAERARLVTESNEGATYTEYEDEEDDE